MSKKAATRVPKRVRNIPAPIVFDAQSQASSTDDKKNIHKQSGATVDAAVPVTPEKKKKRLKKKLRQLGPRRFGDLARQLVYTSRPWTHLEIAPPVSVTDSAGKRIDNTRFEVGAIGFHGTGIEPASADPNNWRSMIAISDAEPGHPASGNAANTANTQKQWLIACAVDCKPGGKTVYRGLHDLLEGSDAPYGLLVLCNSKITRKVRKRYRQFCAQHEIDVFECWGLEEMAERLSQTDHLHLLFQYFGESFSVKSTGSAQALSHAETIRHSLTSAGVGKTINLLTRQPAHLFEFSGCRIAVCRQSPDAFLLVNIVETFNHHVLVALREDFVFADTASNQWDRIDTANLVPDRSSRCPVPNDLADANQQWSGFHADKQFIRIAVSALFFDDILAVEPGSPERGLSETPRLIVKDGVLKRLLANSSDYLGKRHRAESFFCVDGWDRGDLILC